MTDAPAARPEIPVFANLVAGRLLKVVNSAKIQAEGRISGCSIDFSAVFRHIGARKSPAFLRDMEICENRVRRGPLHGGDV